MNNLGVVAELENDPVRAVTLFEGALEIAQKLGTLDEAALETLNLARCLHDTGRSDEAAQTAKKGIVLAREVENVVSLVDGFVLLGGLAHRRGNPRDGARFVGVREGLQPRVAGEVLPDAEAEFFETTVSELVNALGQDEYAKALAEGKAMSLDEAVAYALASVD